MDRDLDGRDPYVLGVFNSRTLSATRISGANVGSLNQCKSITQNTVDLKRNGVLTCVSKDNDGRDPWAPALIQEVRLVKKYSSLGSLRDCTDTINNNIRNRFAISFCVSRDNDGRSPYVRIGVDLANGQESGGASHSSLQDCMNSQFNLLD